MRPATATATEKPKVDPEKPDDPRTKYVCKEILKTVVKRLDYIHHDAHRFHGTLTVEVSYQDGKPTFIRGAVSESVKIY